MNSRKLVAILLAGLMFTASGAALNIEIDLIDFGGDGDDNSSSNNSESTEDNSNDQRFSYGGSDSDQITDDTVEKTLVEKIVSTVVEALFG